MISRLDPEERIFSFKERLHKQLDEMIEVLGWDDMDDIILDVGGTVVSGIKQPPTANERWSVPFGVRKYNKDAFLVIKNLTHDPVITSEPNPELKQAHPYEPSTAQLKKQDDKLGYDTYSK